MDAPRERASISEYGVGVEVFLLHGAEHVEVEHPAWLIDRIEGGRVGRRKRRKPSPTRAESDIAVLEETLTERVTESHDLRCPNAENLGPHELV